MTISCACGAKLKISDDKIPEAGVKVKCPRCATVHLARKPVQHTSPPERKPALIPPTSVERGSVTPTPSMPWFAAASPPERPVPLVLVAHDSKVVADMIEGVLSGVGISMEYASNGLEALQKAAGLKPTLMIVDVGLTGIYGFELCERLKNDPDTRNIKILLLSSVYGLTAYKRAPVTLYGADDYIEKHHIPDKLVPKVRMLLDSGAAATQIQRADIPASAKTVPPPKTTQGAAASSISGKERVLAPSGSADAPQERTRSLVPPAPSSRAAEANAGTPASVKAPSTAAVPGASEGLPKKPVTLDVGRKSRTAASAGRAAALSPQEVPGPASVTPPRTAGMGMVPAVHEDGSVELTAALLEKDEYVAPPRPTAPVALDSKEIEKARRFARIIVSDIVLYNQAAVAEGIAQGTFFELLKDDIAEGRALYDKRVPEPVRKASDYLQEAFDAFIASKKKPR